jgi:hypothetical protein
MRNWVSPSGLAGHFIQYSPSRARICLRTCDTCSMDTITVRKELRAICPIGQSSKVSRSRASQRDLHRLTQLQRPLTRPRPLSGDSSNAVICFN